MIINTNDTPLRDRIDEFNDRIKDLSCFYDHNEQVLDIYEGNLLPHVESLMCETLDENYYSMIKHRILPINFIQKIVDKLAKSYADSPLRQSDEQDFIDEYVRRLNLDSKMMLAEEYSHLNRGYALKPKLTNQGKVKMDVLPYDKFLVIADDKSDNSEPTVFIEFLGKTERSIVDNQGKEQILQVDVRIAYSDKEIIGFDSSGTWIEHIAEDLNYINPIGVIPFVYGNRSVSNIVPKQDTDFLALTKILPLMLSDINGAIMFQCFTLIYGIDVEFNDAKMSPNAIWDLSSKPKSDKPASVGTIQPTVDSDKALTFFKNILAMWLDSKGIDAGSIMSLDSKEVASGLALAMEQIDVTEARKKSISYLAKEEKNLFSLLARMNNYWMKLPGAKDLKLTRVDEKKVDETTEIIFKEPVAKMDYSTEISNSVDMLNNGLSYREKEIRRLHPYITDDEVNLILEEYGVTEAQAEEEEMVAQETEEELSKEDEDISNQTVEE